MTRRDRYDSLLKWYSREHQLDWRDMKAQMLAESDANPRAVSPVGAKGLMQFMPATQGDWFPHGDAFNPEDSIEGGCKYMAWLLRQLDGDVEQARAAYNWGIGHMQRCRERHGDAWRTALPQETQRYLAHIATLRAAMES